MIKMNKIVISMIISATIYAGCSREEIKPGDNMPTEIKTFLTTHYPSQSIIDALPRRFK